MSKLTVSALSVSLARISLTRTVNTGKQLRSARAALSRAQRETQESFKRYKSCLDVEAAAMQQVVAAEERRDALSECNRTQNGCCADERAVSSLMEACRPDGSEGE